VDTARDLLGGSLASIEHELDAHAIHRRAQDAIAAAKTALRAAAEPANTFGMAMTQLGSGGGQTRRRRLEEDLDDEESFV
jgi:hypothetical protein